jgi:hypothetical protein
MSRSVAVPDEVLHQRLPGDELVFLNLQTEEYFGLDATATAMWAALTETGDVEAAFARLREEFDVDEETLRRDLEALLARLLARGLVRLGDDAAGAPAPADPG